MLCKRWVSHMQNYFNVQFFFFFFAMRSIKSLSLKSGSKPQEGVSLFISAIYTLISLSSVTELKRGIAGQSNFRPFLEAFLISQQPMSNSGNPIRISYFSMHRTCLLHCNKAFCSWRDRFTKQALSLKSKKKKTLNILAKPINGRWLAYLPIQRTWRRKRA